MWNKRSEKMVSQSEKPVFIFALARSGSTLLQRSLNLCEDVLISGEHLGILSGVAHSYFSLFERNDSKWFLDRELTIDDLRNPRRHMAVFNNYTSDGLQGSYRNFVRAIGNSFHFDGRWGFKEIRYGRNGMEVFHLILRLFPHSRFIFLIREPASQINSKIKIGYWPEETVETGIEHWLAQVESFRSACDQHPKNCSLITYEDLIESDSTIRSVFSFLDLPFPENVLSEVLHRPPVGPKPENPGLPQQEMDRIKDRCRSLYWYEKWI